MHSFNHQVRQVLSAIIKLLFAMLLCGSALAQVAPKGVGDYPGIPGAIANLNALRVGWYYDWGTSPVEAVDITKSIHISGGELVIPGSVIDKIGLSGATPGDLSDPGMVFVIQ